ncbi:tryptophan 7-halogenase [Niveispirillum fermenti]|uniref:tryptophan 7-halogenase n=1 Tax=Niveispirillum fermenti TaxID=1233113 RepID=UPI003A8AE0C4
MKSGLHDIVIAGAGLAGWLAACALARVHAGRGGSVTLVPVSGPDDSLDPFGPVAPALPGFGAAFARLGLEEGEVLRAGGGGFSLGTAFTGWAGPSSVSFQPFGDTGAELNGVGFTQLVWRARQTGRGLRMTDYSLATLAAQMDRFSLPVADTRSVLSTLAYGAFLELGGLAALARRRAEAAGARQASSPLAGVERTGDGNVAALVLADGARLAGDWFIDATGPSALLCRPDNGWQDWGRWLPCDKVAIVPVAPDGPPPPYGLHAAEPAGWTRRLPLRRGAWTARLSASAVGPADTATRSFTCGRRRSPWQGNVLALGGAAAILDPVGGASLSLLLSAIGRLVGLYPVDPRNGAEAGEYDRQTIDELERARDFLILRYKLNGRRGDPLWDAARDMAVPDSLTHKMALYESRGRIPLLDGELFSRSDWANLFDSQGVRARRCDIQAAALPDTAILAHLERLRTLLLRAAGGLPPHVRALAHLSGGT